MIRYDENLWAGASYDVIDTAIKAQQAKADVIRRIFWKASFLTALIGLAAIAATGSPHSTPAANSTPTSPGTRVELRQE